LSESSISKSRPLSTINSGIYSIPKLAQIWRLILTIDFHAKLSDTWKWTATTDGLFIFAAVFSGLRPVLVDFEWYNVI